MSDIDAAASFLDHPSNGDENDEVDSLPSDSDSDDDTTSEDYSESDAEREWKESLQQLELLLTMVIVPYMGKYFGRKFAYWGWKQYMEWNYPVEVVVTNKSAFKGFGAVVAAAPL
ncbi:hypothetical protein A1O3_02932 [Capronia epimyces CBS 606.96]|uniref:Uncharacterized protein n=1 Tax=Capronia epimyces CBS 606.96 TaxID=1182542 RepID=W9YJM5_9EURO|nr:uncharacterized protein A1O3_02932 [Capronia epimyces CBS 606.96]EXJ89865.1 hypothetical protein A1O3_02932 [Capronia epimyces CBS 606.96]